MSSPSLRIGGSPVTRSITESRVCPMVQWLAEYRPQASGPRWSMVRTWRSTNVGSMPPRASNTPAIPHIRAARLGARGEIASDSTSRCGCSRVRVRWRRSRSLWSPGSPHRFSARRRAFGTADDVTASGTASDSDWCRSGRSPNNCKAPSERWIRLLRVPRSSPTFNDLRLGVGDTSLDQELGRYYWDMTPALPLIEAGYHGPFDESGVPRVVYGGKAFYNGTITAQYALALHDALLRTTDPHSRADSERKLRVQMDAMAAQIEPAGERRGFALLVWDSSKYADLKAPWVSAIVQGTMISALLRGYQRWGCESWMEAASLAFGAMKEPVAAGGTCIQVGEDLWFEEHPMDPPSHVLNGHVFALWGVLDWARATGDESAWQLWRQGAATLGRHLPE